MRLGLAVLLLAVSLSCSREPSVVPVLVRGDAEVLRAVRLAAEELNAAGGVVFGHRFHVRTEGPAPVTIVAGRPDEAPDGTLVLSTGVGGDGHWGVAVPEDRLLGAAVRWSMDELGARRVAGPQALTAVCDELACQVADAAPDVVVGSSWPDDPPDGYVAALNGPDPADPEAQAFFRMFGGEPTREAAAAYELMRYVVSDLTQVAHEAGDDPAARGALLEAMREAVEARRPFEALVDEGLRFEPDGTVSGPVVVWRSEGGERVRAGTAVAR